MECQEVVQVALFGVRSARAHHGIHRLGYPKSQHQAPLQHHLQSAQLEIEERQDHGVEVDEEGFHAFAVCDHRPSLCQHHPHPVHRLTFCWSCASQSSGPHVADVLGAWLQQVKKFDLRHQPNVSHGVFQLESKLFHEQASMCQHCQYRGQAELRPRQQGLST